MRGDHIIAAVVGGLSLAAIITLVIIVTKPKSKPSKDSDPNHPQMQTMHRDTKGDAAHPLGFTGWMWNGNLPLDAKKIGWFGSSLKVLFSSTCGWAPYDSPGFDKTVWIFPKGELNDNYHTQKSRLKNANFELQGLTNREYFFLKDKKFYYICSDDDDDNPNEHDLNLMALNNWTACNGSWEPMLYFTDYHFRIRGTTRVSVMTKPDPSKPIDTGVYGPLYYSWDGVKLQFDIKTSTQTYSPTWDLTDLAGDDGLDHDGVSQYDDLVVDRIWQLLKWPNYATTKTTL